MAPVSKKSSISRSHAKSSPKMSAADGHSSEKRVTRITQYTYRKHMHWKAVNTQHYCRLCTLHALSLMRPWSRGDRAGNTKACYVNWSFITLSKFRMYFLSFCFFLFIIFIFYFYFLSQTGCIAVQRNNATRWQLTQYWALVPTCIHWMVSYVRLRVTDLGKCKALAAWSCWSCHNNIIAETAILTQQCWKLQVSLGSPGTGSYYWKLLFGSAISFCFSIY